MEENEHSTGPGGLRLDIWLWSARFFRTRTLAKEAIEGGKVQVEGQKAKVSKLLRAGNRLRIRQGHDELDVVVMALSDRRGGAPEARLLYQETEESRLRREQAQAQRRLAAETAPQERPNKKARRMLHHFKRQHGF